MDIETWEHAQRIFKDVRAMSGQLRDAYVRRECSDNLPLLTLVEGLLHGDSLTGDPVLDSIGSAASEWRDNGIDHWLGKTIGSFRIEERIAEGGMGIVFRASRIDQHFDQQVAIKLIATRLATDSAREKFLAERQILANLVHPNIAGLLDGGETPEGIPYLVMELIDGEPIDEYCERNNLSVRSRIELFLLVCSAVQHAHQNLVVHRDIKAHNILVTPDGTPKLLDFGIAKLLAADPLSSNAAATVEGHRALTIRNASPEQILGQPITTASDVYSLGLLLYELLTGAYPFDIAENSASSESGKAICEQEPAVPSKQVLKATAANNIGNSQNSAQGALAKSLHGDLDTIILKSLRKQAADRYSTAQQLAGDLERHLANIPILARRRTSAYLLSRYWRRNKAVVAGVAATMVAVLIGATVSSVGFYQARSAEQLALTEAREAAAISEFLVSLFEEANPNTSVGDERSVREVLDEGLARTQSELGDSPEIRLRIIETLASVYKSLAEYETAEILLREALLIEPTTSSDLFARARLLNDIGDIYRIQSRLPEAATSISESIDLYRSDDAAPPDQLADALNNMALTLMESGELDAPRTMFEEVLDLRQSIFEAPHPDIALSLHNLAYYYGRIGSYEIAEQYAKAAVEMRVAVFGENHPRVASTVGLLSRHFRDQGKWVEAEIEARRSVKIAENIFDSGHPDLSFPLYELGMIQWETGNLLEARETLEQVLEWEKVSMGASSHPVGMNLKSIGELALILGEYDAAEEHLRNAEAILSAIPGNEKSAMRALIGNGTANLRAGRISTAERLIVAANENAIATWGEDSEIAIKSSLARIELLLEQEMTDQALSLVVPLIELLRSSQLNDIDLHLSVLHSLGRSHNQASDSGNAIAAYDKALALATERWSHDHWRVAEIRCDLGRAQQTSGSASAGMQNIARAEADLRSALGAANTAAQCK